VALQRIVEMPLSRIRQHGIDRTFVVESCGWMMASTLPVCFWTGLCCRDAPPRKSRTTDGLLGWKHKPSAGLFGFEIPSFLRLRVGE